MKDSLWRKRLTRDDTEHGKHYYLADDDDIQDYKKPWVGLTEEERRDIYKWGPSPSDAVYLTETKLKQKNT
jgi:hypothetical protein